MAQARPFLLLALGAALVVAGRLGDSLLGHAGSSFGWKQATVLVLGAALVVAGVAQARLPQDEDQPARGAWAVWLALGLLGALVLWSRLGGLNQSLWHDEVFSALYYIDAGPKAIASGDYVPNNHVLFNLFAYATTRVFGESEVTLRLWSVVPAIAAAAVMVWWTWRVRDRWTALVFAVLVATSPIHHDLAREARGYGLMFLAGALMLVFAYRVVSGGGRWDWILLGLSGVVGAFTAPQFVLGFVGQAIPLLLRPDLRRRTLIMLGAVAAVLVGIYAPLLSDIVDSSDTVSGGPLPWYSAVSGPILHLVQPSLDLLADRPTDAYLITPDTPDQILGGLVLVIGALLLWRTRERMLCALLVVPPLFVYTVLTVARFHVHERYGSFLLFHALVLASVAVVGVVRMLPRGVPRYAAAAVGAIAAAVLVVNTIDRSDRYQELPRENFKRVSEIVKARGETEVVTDSTRPDGLRYYFGARNVAAPVESVCVSPPAVFVEHPYRSEGEPPFPDTGCLQRLGETRVRVYQRDRGGHIDVWFASP